MIPSLTPAQLDAMAGTRHAATGMEFPPVGLQPYYAWLMDTLHRLAEAGCGAFRVVLDDSGPAAVGVMPGRCSIDGVPLSFPGAVLDLAAHNNDTALLWVHDEGGTAVVGVGSAAAGWPAGPHLKLAEVTLAAGRVAAVLDRRFETVFAA